MDLGWTAVALHLANVEPALQGQRHQRSNVCAYSRQWICLRVQESSVRTTTAVAGLSLMGLLIVRWGIGRVPVFWCACGEHILERGDPISPQWPRAIRELTFGVGHHWQFQGPGLSLRGGSPGTACVGTDGSSVTATGVRRYDFQ